MEFQLTESKKPPLMISFRWVVGEKPAPPKPVRAASYDSIPDLVEDDEESKSSSEDHLRFEHTFNGLHRRDDYYF
jgi:hypothetical protein